MIYIHFERSPCGVATVYYVGISIGSRTGQGSYQMRGCYDNGLWICHYKCIEQGNSEGQEGLILIVHSPALVDDRVI